MKNAKELALLAARALSDKKGKEIQVLEIGELTTLADYFVIATGSSNTQINALVDNVEKVLLEEAEEDSPAPGGLPWRHVGAAGLRLHRCPRL
ncbi:MAG: RsfS/YbeB/iojap family protein [Oscillospiraceae bacterium]